MGYPPKRPSESDRSYSYFVTFCLLDPSLPKSNPKARSLANVAAVHETSIQNMHSLSARYKWTERAAEYDENNQTAHKHAAEKVAKRTYSTDKTTKLLMSLYRVTERKIEQLSTMPVDDVPTDEIAKLAKALKQIDDLIKLPKPEEAKTEREVDTFVLTLED